MEQVARRLVPRKRLAQLLGRPRRRRMCGNRDMPDASPIVGEEHEDEQEAIGHGRDHEEIGRHDLADVIRQERAPGLGGRLAWAPHVFRDRRLTDVDLQFQQFAMNPRRAPTRVRLRDRANQRADVEWHDRSTQPATTLPTSRTRGSLADARR